MADFGFVGAAYQAASITQDAQELINRYPEIDPQKEGRGVVALYPCPGLLQLMQSATIAPVRGFRVLPGGQTLLAAIGNKLYSITLSYIATAVGTLLSGTGPVSITDNGVSAYLGDGPNRYSYTWGTSTFAVVSDGAFNGANVVDVIDNFIVYNNPNSNQFGCTNVASVVSGALNFASTLSAPGNIAGLICDHRQVFVLGEVASEVWVDAGLNPFPFQILAGSNMQHGCAAIGSIARLGESFAMLAQDTRGQAVVIQMNGYSPARISTHAIEQAMAGYGQISDAIGYTYQEAGHEFYMITFPAADVTWCYDLATELWHRRAWRDTHGVLHRHRSNCCAVFGGRIIVGDWQNGIIYQMSRSTFTDNGVTIPRVRTCRHLTQDLKRVFYNSLQVQYQPGVGLQTGQGSNPQAILEMSDDGGFTYGNQHFATLGKAGMYKNRCIWRQLGQARDRIFRVTDTDPVFGVIVSGELDAQAGIH